MATDVPAIEVDTLTKRFGTVTAVDALSFDVPRASVTGFLGPNGAGKTTTMRVILGLASPTQGSARILGAPYDRLSRPLARVGAALEVTGFHPGRTARNHLAIVALQGGLQADRVDAVLARTGMQEYAGRRVGGFSAGMRQRLALATALLGEPDVLVLDEPANGLDPAGVAWLRGFIRRFADDGGSVLISSHILSEVAEVADRVDLVITNYPQAASSSAGRRRLAYRCVPWTAGSRNHAAGGRRRSSCTDGFNRSAVVDEPRGRPAARGGHLDCLDHQLGPKWEAIAQPTIRRDHRSITAATWRSPSP